MKRNYIRLKPEEIKKRVLELETLFGQKALSKKLGVSVDSVRRYRDGKTAPQTKTIYNKLNTLYNQKKKFIDTGAVETKRKQIEKRKTIQKSGAKKERFAIIYPDYMYNSPASEFSDVRKFERLEDLHQAGYVAGWVGGKEIPLEVQFVINGENLSRWGKVLNIVGIVSKEISPKAENDYTGQDTTLEVYPTYFRLIPGLKKNLKFNEKLDKVREFFFENVNVERGYTLAFLGYYFDELDEI
jgi:hypothetical protein